MNRKKREQKLLNKNRRKPQTQTVLKFQAADYYTQQLMSSKSLTPNFKVNIPSNTGITHKTLLLYFRNSLGIDSCKQVQLQGIRHSLDYFSPVPVLGRLKDLKLNQILYKISPDFVSDGSESSSEEDDMSDSHVSESESASHTETEQSQDEDTPADKKTAQDQAL